MKGSVHKRGSTWYYVVDLPRIDGTRRQKRKGGFRTKKECESALAQLLVSSGNEISIRPRVETVEVYLLQWLKWKEGSVAPSSVVIYANLIHSHLIPPLGQIQLQQLAPGHIQHMLAILAESGLSPRMQKMTFICLKSALGQAVKEKLISANPCDLVSTPKAQQKQFRTWTAEQVARFLHETQEDRYYVAYVLGALGGLRLGEVLALRWSDVQWETHMLSIRHTIQRHTDRTWTLASPKTPKSRRTIPLTPRMEAALRDRKVKQDLERELAGDSWHEQDLVLCSMRGEILEHNTIGSRFRYLQAQLGMPKIRFHDLRHTCATLLLQAGVHPKIVQERLGHASITMTLDTYSHVIPGMQKEASDRLDEIVFGDV